MNLILLSPDDFTDSPQRVRLTDRRYKHIREILKSSAGDELCVGLINGKIGKGRILKVNDEAVDMEIFLDKDPPAPLPLILILALPRPIVLNRLFGSVAALGVKKIILMQSNRVEKNYWKSPALKEENINARLVLRFHCISLYMRSLFSKFHPVHQNRQTVAGLAFFGLTPPVKAAGRASLLMSSYKAAGILRKRAKRV